MLPIMPPATPSTAVNCAVTEVIAATGVADRAENRRRPHTRFWGPTQALPPDPPPPTPGPGRNHATARAWPVKFRGPTGSCLGATCPLSAGAGRDMVTRPLFLERMS